MSVDLTRFERKVAWGEKHLDTLESEIATFVSRIKNGEGHETFLHPQGDDEWEPIYIRIKQWVADDIERFAFHASDVINPVRSALDNAVTAIDSASAGVHGHNPSYPVFVEEKTFKADGRKRIVGLPDATRAFIKDSQPYGRANYKRDALYVLHELWLDDKHRIPPVVAVGAAHVTITGQMRSTDGRAATVGRGTLEGFGGWSLVDGAVIGRVKWGAKTDNAEMGMKADITAQVLFDKTSAASDNEVVFALRQFITMAKLYLAELKTTL